METYIAVLRGINVSGHNIIKMDVLRKLFEDSGYGNVRTYIQSGNVIFANVKTVAGKLEKNISEKILNAFGFDVPVIVRDLNEMKKLIKGNPFLKNAGQDVKNLYAILLSNEPAKELTGKIPEVPNDSTIYRITGKTVYLYCPGGYGNTKLTNAFFEKHLRVTATARNWRTICELAKIAGDIQTAGVR